MHHGSHGAPTEGVVIRWPRIYDLVMQVASLGRERRIRQQVLDVANIAPGQRVLDVGCGTGTLALVAAKTLGDSGFVCGIDPAAEMVERARVKAVRAGCVVSFQVGAIEELPFADRSIDVVFSTLVLHHLPEKLRAKGLGEVRRVLSVGGRFVLVDFGGCAHALSLLHGAGFATVEEATIRPRALFMLVATASFAESEMRSTNE